MIIIYIPLLHKIILYFSWVSIMSSILFKFLNYNKLLFISSILTLILGIIYYLLGKRIGSIIGHITLQDQEFSNIEIKVLHNKFEIKKIKINSNKDFLIKILQNEIYYFSFSCKGYITEIRNVINLISNEKNIGTIELEVIPKSVYILVQDKTGNYYSNFKISIKNENTNLNQVFDVNLNGEINTTLLNFGNYEIYFGSETGINNIFLWSVNDKRTGKFTLKASEDKYYITLPRVVYWNIGGNNNAQYFDLNGIKYIAQYFELKKDVKFSGIGFGLGKNSKLFQIRENQNGYPSNDIKYLSFSTLSANGAISLNSGKEAPFAYFVKEDSYEQINLLKGEYWLIAKFNVSENIIPIYGGTEKAIMNDEILSSKDGITWDRFLLPTELKSSLIFIVE